MKTLKFLTFASIFLLAFNSCSDDDDNTTDDSMDPSESANLYATSNTDGNIHSYEMEDEQQTDSKTLLTLSLDAEGVFYDPSTDEVTQASRTLLQLNSYADVSIAADGVTVDVNASSSANLVSPRDIAVNGNIYVVADNSDVDGDDTTADGRLFVYTKNGTNFTLRNTVTVEFAVWGIEFVGNNLYAVVDKTSDVALFTNFATSNTTDATVSPTKRVTIEGIVRTHGIGFDGDTMILTDIGDASVDNDGGFHIISDFESKFSGVANGGTLVVANNQIRISGAATFLGNPVSADYDQDSETVFIAERANNGGRVLVFTNLDAGGNIAPSINNNLSGASSVYFAKE